MKKVLFTVFLLIVAAIVAVMVYTTQQNEDVVEAPSVTITPTATTTPVLTPSPISSFQECVEAGYRVQESYPAVCITPEGQEFIQPIDENNQTADIIVKNIQENQIISSPLTLEGEARGTWYFEATFPVTLLDSEENVLVESFATAKGEWMTEDFVPFTADLQFTTSSTQDGTLILQKANPSGLPEKDEEIRIPVTISPQ